MLSKGLLAAEEVERNPDGEVLHPTGMTAEAFNSWVHSDDCATISDEASPERAEEDLAIAIKENEEAEATTKAVVDQYQEELAEPVPGWAKIWAALIVLHGGPSSWSIWHSMIFDAWKINEEAPRRQVFSGADNSRLLFLTKVWFGLTETK